MTPDAVIRGITAFILGFALAGMWVSLSHSQTVKLRGVDLPCSFLTAGTEKQRAANILKYNVTAEEAARIVAACAGQRK